VASSSWSLQTRLLFLLLVTFWGMNYLFVKVGLEYASPLWLAALRSGVGVVASVPVVLAAQGWGHLDRTARRDALLRGLPNTAVFFGLWFYAAQDVPPGFAAIVIYTFPLWVALLSQPFLGQPLGPRHWVSVGIGFAGVALISQIGQAGGAGVPFLAVLLLLAAAISWALGTVFFQRRFHGAQMLEANTFQLLGGTGALFVAALVLTPRPIPIPSAELAASVLWLGVLGTAFAYSIWFSLLGRTRAAAISAYVFLVPVVALAASVIFLGERLTWVQLGGVGLVLVSIYVIGRARWADAVRTSSAPPPAPSR
jgi:O-acetylserine/cysteine efflux transporter